ncbi:hypothetical protein Asi02nite_47750 [Asanoa siamensis]|uniref:DUF4157 domain-containing protein n=1 Tax=Asanoa siamensis TaxID=926357 RepID=A0ABQ4CVE0_9ACTN|nr:hypothetical protein Asi02nite_47750 [Asanoa siamensis]
MNRRTARSVGERYGVDLADVRIRVRMKEAGYFGFTNDRQHVVLARDAFANEEEMARTLFHERHHVGQLRAGTPYPRSDLEAAAMERETYAAERRWWDSHPLNPANRASGGPS